MRKISDRVVVLVLAEGEGCGVVHMTVDGARLAGHRLDHHSNGHTAGEAVRIENNVGKHAVGRPGDVLAGPLLAADSLLAGARGKLVADRGVARHAIADASTVLFTRRRVVGTKLNRVDNGRLLGLVLFHKELELVDIEVAVERRAFGHLGARVR